MRVLYSAEDERRPFDLNGSNSSAEKWRTSWRQDYARILHSASFRRLQGKKQLFPGDESDFFRTRLTHSLEVAQVAKSIAIRINATHTQFKRDPIITDIVEAAALAHDIGHPPFGHNGEEALNECMRNHGGFEGNAQTLRILSKLEKKQTASRDQDNFVQVKNGTDNRAGLNLTYRTLAAVLKYDKQIPADTCHVTNGAAKVLKGYYATEAKLVEEIKAHVAPGIKSDEKFKTIECSIMDIADDIAYSTYDLEDSFKAGFLSPLEMLSAPDELKDRVAEIIKDRIDRAYPEVSQEDRAFDKGHVTAILYEIFGHHFRAALNVSTPKGKIKSTELKELQFAEAAARLYGTSKRTAESGYFRTEFTSNLVGAFISGVEVITHKKYRALTNARLSLPTFKKVEVLKNYAFQSLIMSPMLKISEHRGKDIVTAIFNTLSAPGGDLLLPDDCRELFRAFSSEADKMRVICDFIANMTDQYAIKFFGRLQDPNPESIFSPLT